MVCRIVNSFRDGPHCVISIWSKCPGIPGTSSRTGTQGLGFQGLNEPEIQLRVGLRDLAPPGLNPSAESVIRRPL
jgi:hypothetical protein